jgi:hypothetical protein
MDGMVNIFTRLPLIIANIFTKILTSDRKTLTFYFVILIIIFLLISMVVWWTL